MILVQSHNSEVRCQQIPNVCMYVSMNIWILHKWDNPLNQLGLYVCMCMYVYVLYDVLYKECVKWDMNMVDEAVKRYVWMNVCTYVCMYVCMYAYLVDWLRTHHMFAQSNLERLCMLKSATSTIFCKLNIRGVDESIEESCAAAHIIVCIMKLMSVRMRTHTAHAYT